MLWMQRTLLSAAILGFLAVGCSEDVSSVGGIKDTLPDVTYLAFTVDFAADSAGCLLSLSAMDGSGGTSVYFKLLPGTAPLLLKVPVGRYVPERLSCGIYRTLRFDTIGVWAAPIAAYAGKVNYAGHLHFALHGTADHANVQYFDNAESKPLETFIAQLKPADASRLVSAYTGKAVTKDNAHVKARSRPFLTWTSEKTRLKKENIHWNMNQFDACYEAERAIDPLMLGDIELRATFRDEKMAGLTTLRDHSAMRDEFAACLREKVKVGLLLKGSGLVTLDIKI